MLYLTEMFIEGLFISATVTTVEVTPLVFYITVNLETHEITKNSLGKIDMNVNMARNKLISTYKEYGEDLPKKVVCAWY